MVDAKKMLETRIKNLEYLRQSRSKVITKKEAFCEQRKIGYKMTHEV